MAPQQQQWQQQWPQQRQQQWQQQQQQQWQQQQQQQPQQQEQQRYHSPSQTHKYAHSTLVAYVTNQTNLHLPVRVVMGLLNQSRLARSVNNEARLRIMMIDGGFAITHLQGQPPDYGEGGIGGQPYTMWGGQVSGNPGQQEDDDDCCCCCVM
ncbi:MAG: hypothetical protein M1813_003975 [Trichoglossum hirsutum]|nr:MAG: hypothetical protein M1813_003975 [Trichoglossum hirsutum]